MPATDPLFDLNVPLEDLGLAASLSPVAGSVAADENRNVISLPTKPDDTQPWQCLVCGATMEYAQPISLRVMCEKLGAFIEEHKHPEAAARPA